MKKYLLVLTAILIAGCDLDKVNYECTVEGVEGTFVSSRSYIRTTRNMVTMYRINSSGTRRTFMFPHERVQCMDGSTDD